MSSPFSIIDFNFYPNSLPERTSNLSRSPVERWHMQNLYSILNACVPLPLIDIKYIPAPGKPNRTILFD